MDLVGLALACSIVFAQQSSPEYVVPEFAAELRRLPPVDSMPEFAQPCVHPSANQTAAEEPPASQASTTDRSEKQAARKEPAPKPVAKLWKGSFELGLSGTEGNSQTLNFRVGFDAKRKTRCNVVTIDLDYHKNSNDSRETANRALFDGRYERLMCDTPWSSFVHGTVEYDEFKPFDVLSTGDVGVGRELLKTDFSSLLVRAGGGVSHELGGPNPGFTPELVYGLDGEHKFSQRQKLTASIEYSPDVTDYDYFRVKTKAAWEILLDEEMNLSMKLNALDRYYSTPDNRKPNDVDYSIVLLWSF